MDERDDEGGSADGVEEHALACPYCWESITVLVDTSVPDQEYVEDCEVCCNPIAIHVTARSGRVTALDAHPLP
ncbi:MAG: CPXCG motif-containing cysteine-rich protein [Gemmatimonadales bacterium]